MRHSTSRVAFHEGINLFYWSPRSRFVYDRYNRIVTTEAYNLDAARRAVRSRVK